MKRGAFWIGMALSLALLLFFFRGVKASELWQSLMRANYLLILPGIAFYFAGVWVRTLRWRFLLLPLGRFSPLRLFTPVVIGFAINNLVPGKLGLAARAYFLGQREGVSKVASGASIVLDNVFDGLALLFLALLIILLFPVALWLKWVALLAALLYGGFSLLFFSLALSPRVVKRWLEPLFRHSWGEKVERWLGSAYTGLASLRRPPELLLIFLLSLTIWVLEAGMFYFLALSFQVKLPFYAILLATAIANLALALPSLPGGIGPFEYFGKQALVLFGVKEAAATALVGTLHLALLFPVTLLGLFFLGWQRRALTSWRGAKG